jgi:hypothetical protein
MAAYCDNCGKKVEGNPVEHFRKCGRLDRNIMAIGFCVLVVLLIFRSAWQ